VSNWIGRTRYSSGGGRHERLPNEGTTTMSAKTRAFEPSALGIMQCLRTLAQEAESLELRNTLVAICHAARTVAWEIGAMADRDGATLAAMPPAILH
jgi:hypothetical protein